MAFLRKIRGFAAGLLAIVLLPVLLPPAGIFKRSEKGRAITPADFAALLRRIGDDNVDRGEWDEFECVRPRGQAS